jgi:hypothetical protein
VHEEADRPPCEKSNNPQLTYADDRILDAIDKLSCENKRLVALQTVTAYQTARTARWIMILTFVLVILTFLLVADVSFDASGFHWRKSTREQEFNSTTNSNINEKTHKQEPKPAHDP